MILCGGGADDAVRNRVNMLGEIQRVGSNFDFKRGVIEVERKDLRGVCAECDGVWK